MQIDIRDDAIGIGDRFTISFQRTLRVPDDGKAYPLPPGLGRFPTIAVTQAHASRLVGPQPGDALIPMRQDEALWLGFDGASWKPSAVKIAAGRVNVLTGEVDDDGLRAEPQNYMVCPPQPWLDGINAGEARVRQFVATPLGHSDTIEGQLTGEEHGSIRVTVYDPRPGIFPESEPPWDQRPQRARRMGLGAGGAVVQRVYPDPYGLNTWDTSACGEVTVHILNSAQFEAITGHPAPPSPISAETYTEHGFPWFALYDEHLGDIPAAGPLRHVQSTSERRRERGAAGGDEHGLDVPASQVTRLHPDRPPPPARPDQS